MQSGRSSQLTNRFTGRRFHVANLPFPLKFHFLLWHPWSWQWPRQLHLSVYSSSLFPSSVVSRCSLDLIVDHNTARCLPLSVVVDGKVNLSARTSHFDVPSEVVEDLPKAVGKSRQRGNANLRIAVDATQLRHTSNPSLWGRAGGGDINLLAGSLQSRVLRRVELVYRHFDRFACRHIITLGLGQQPILLSSTHVGHVLPS